MLGGLARRVSLVEKLGSEDRSLLVVDSGNLFTGAWAGANQKQSRIKARLISRAYMRMGVAAINVGDLDLLQGLAFLRKEASRGLPLVSSNLVDPSTKTSIVKPYIIKKVGSIRVAFFGLLSADIRTDIYKEAGDVCGQAATNLCQCILTLQLRKDGGASKAAGFIRG